MRIIECWKYYLFWKLSSLLSLIQLFIYNFIVEYNWLIKNKILGVIEMENRSFVKENVSGQCCKKFIFVVKWILQPLDKVSRG